MFMGEDPERVERVYVEHRKMQASEVLSLSYIVICYVRKYRYSNPCSDYFNHLELSPNRLSKLSPTASDRIILTSITSGVCGFTT